MKSNAVAPQAQSPETNAKKEDETGVPTKALPQDSIPREMLDKEDYASATWIKPSKEKIAHNLRFKDGKAKFFTTTVDDLGEMGVGIVLYFQTIRNLCILFFVCSILSVPSIWLNAGGDAIARQDADSSGLVYLTLGNRRASDCTALDNIAVDPLTCKAGKSTVNISSIDYVKVWDATTVSSTVMAMDIIYSIFFVVFLVYMSTTVDNVVADVDEEYVSAADYAVLIRGLPKSATEEDIRRFFSDRYDLKQCSMRYYPMFCGCWGKVANRKSKTSSVLPEEAASQQGVAEEPVKDLAYCDGDSSYANSWVAEVSVAHPNGDQISHFLLKSKMYHKLREARARVQKYSLGTPHKKGPNEAKRIKAMEHLTKLEEWIDEAAAKLNQKQVAKESQSTQCECAFVLFENEQSLNICNDDYRTSHSWLNRYFQPRSLRFPEKTASGGVKYHPIWVRPAPEPSVILWENLEITGFEYQLRCVMTSLATFLLICVACAMIMMAKKYQNDYQSAIPTASECNTALQACDWEVFELGQLKSCTATSGYSYDRSLKCFCKEMLGQYVSEHGALGGTAKLGESVPDCKDYADNAYTSMALTVVAAFVVVALNIALQMILKALTEFERHDSVSDESASISLKIFLATFLNTALILLLVNAQFVDGNGDSYLPGGFPLFSGSFTDMTRGWYTVVGAGLSLTMALNVFSPHLQPAVQCLLVQPIQRLRLSSSAASQYKLDELHTGPEFLLHVRYPVILNTVCTTMMYAGGMPMLLPFALIFCVLCYLLDKALLLYVYKRPPSYDASLAYTMLGILPWALCGHLGFSVWFYSNTEMLQSTLAGVNFESSDGFIALIFAKGSRSSTLPVFLFAIGVLGFLMYNLLIAKFLHNCGLFESTTVTGQFQEAIVSFSKLAKGRSLWIDKLEREGVPPYSKTFEHCVIVRKKKNNQKKNQEKNQENNQAAEGQAEEVPDSGGDSAPKVSDQDKAIGVRIVAKEGVQGADGKAQYVKHMYYPTDRAVEVTTKNTTDGVEKKQRSEGAQMMTWEAIQGLHSYRLMANARYRAAMRMLSAVAATAHRNTLSLEDVSDDSNGPNDDLNDEPAVDAPAAPVAASADEPINKQTDTVANVAAAPDVVPAASTEPGLVSGGGSNDGFAAAE
jgi:RNA recognition motif-containing protein